MYTKRSFLAVGALAIVALAQTRLESGPPRESMKRTVTGPNGPINEAIAAGATATVTLQPVPPKTVPASSYPPGSSIVGSTLTLGSVPARIWIEGQITGWAPQSLGAVQISVSANDPEMDGGGYSGAAAECNGIPVIGAGDITPARQACDTNADCRPTMSGLSSPCSSGEPCRCYTWDGQSPGPYFPPGKWCEPGFQDKCDAQWIGSGIPSTPGIDTSSVNYRFGAAIEPGETAPDFAPSYVATVVLDVPADAAGTYTIDMWESQTFMVNFNAPPGNQIPIAALNSAVIKIPMCNSNSECNDNDTCTLDVCQDGCCDHSPVASWNPATECCNPANGVQAPIPQSTACRIGGCSLGGSSGVSSLTLLSDGTACVHEDPCILEGECMSGACIGEQYAGSDCPKPRFISFEADPAGTPLAYRVRLVSLHHPDPPYSGGVVADFTEFEGEVRWVGPPTSYVESTSIPIPLRAAFAGCIPHYQDWSSVGLLHVGGAEIMPSSIYEVQSIPQGLDINIESNYSAPQTIATSRWADMVVPRNAPGVNGQPDFGDVSALVDKFRSWPSAISKPRAQLVGSGGTGVPDLGSDIDFMEISAANDAFRGTPYNIPGPTHCP